MVAIVCLSRAGSSSGRYCADSAWARITASEWPTTSCTSRARRAWSSRSRAISRACSVSRRRARPPPRRATCETLRRAGPVGEAQGERRPATAAAEHGASTTTAAPSRQVLPKR